MAEYRYISLQQVLDNLLEHPLLKDLTLERVAHYALRLMKIVGIPVVFENKVEKISYDDYRAPLPCGLYRIIQVKSVGKGHKNFCYRYTTDNFHLSTKDDPCPFGKVNDYTYMTQNSMIFFSKKKDDIEISYSAIPVDTNGMPMIVDNESFIRALESYIKYERFKMLRDTGQMDRFTFDSVEQEYAFDIAQASNSLMMPSVDEMESFTNMWSTFFTRREGHYDGFSEYSRPEFTRRF